MSAIPCKRPKVTVDPRGNDRDAVDANCHVPGCGWTYPSDKQFMALKSDANDQATRHRGEHRAGVPRIETKTLDSGRNVDQCMHCGWVTTFHTRVDRDAQVAYHLSTHHGVVVCS